MSKIRPSIDHVCTFLKTKANIKFNDQRLWLGIVLQSIEDLRVNKYTNSDIDKKQKVITRIKKINREDIKSALDFHESHYFITVCQFAGLDPAMTRLAIRSIYE